MTIVIYGATGYTGHLIVEEARRRGLRPILAGRRQAALEALAAQWSPALETRLADPSDHEALRAMLVGASVLITSVGPFTDYGLGVAAAAAEAGVHYLDTTGEQTFMADCRTLFHERMRAGRRAMINAAAFEYTPGTLAAARFVAEHPSKTLDITYAMGGGASRGTMKSILRLAGATGIGFRAGVYEPLRALDATRATALEPGGEPHSTVLFPGGEILAVPRFASVSDVRTWLVVPGMMAKMRPVGQVLLSGAQDGLAYAALSAMIDRLPQGPDATKRQASAGHIIIEGEGARADVHCPDPYGLTAQIAVELAVKLAAGEERQHGVISAAEAFDSAELWQQLEQWGVTYRLQG